MQSLLRHMVRLALVSIFVILATSCSQAPSKSRIRVLQSIGRGLRRSEHKDSTILYDIADDLTYRGKTKLHSQSFFRQTKYIQ